MSNVDAKTSINFRLYGKLLVVQNEFCDAGSIRKICYTINRPLKLIIPVMPLVIVSKIACQRLFQLSDPDVLRTFVEDCRYFGNRITTNCQLDKF